jgi:hypothetical protein
MSLEHIDVPPGRAAQSLWCDRNWHDGTCCPGSAESWERPWTSAGRPRAARRAESAHDRGDHSACNRNCEHTL